MPWTAFGFWCAASLLLLSVLVLLAAPFIP
jgi:hypothetical protein